MNKETSSAPSLAISADADDGNEQLQGSKVSDMGRRVLEESGATSDVAERERFEVKNTYGGPPSQKASSTSYSQNSMDTEEKAQKVSPPRRKAFRDEKTENHEKPGNWSKNHVSNSDSFLGIPSIKSTSIPSTKSTGIPSVKNTSIPSIKSVGLKLQEVESPPEDDSINEILEVWS